MLEYICNMAIGLSDKQAEVIVAIIGLLSAMIVAGIGLFGSALTRKKCQTPGTKL